jgi:hypothetical protein
LIPPGEVRGVTEHLRGLAILVSRARGDMERSAAEQMTVVTGEPGKVIEDAAPLLLPAPASGVAPGLGAQFHYFH